MTRIVFRLVILVILIIAYLAKAPDRSRYKCLLRSSRYARWGMRVLGFHVKIDLPSRPKSGLVVCNHLSWIDAFVLFACYPLVFITSVEVENTPFLGWMCKRAGCLFVERRGTRAVSADQKRVAGELKKNAIVVFPEATSGNGDALLPFKPAFFESARQAEVPVHTVAITYDALDGKPITTQNRDDVYWYGDMDFLPHLTRLMTLHHRYDITLHGLGTLLWGGETKDRKGMAAKAHALIAAKIRRPLRYRSSGQVSA